MAVVSANGCLWLPATLGLGATARWKEQETETELHFVMIALHSSYRRFSGGSEVDDS